ncbi:MAG: hypothetical protein QXT74_04155, partial [Candidatus Nezhaarchaeales archaeon]
ERPRCGLVIDRQKNASIDVWKTFLRTWGAMGSPRRELTPMSFEEDERDGAQELSMDTYPYLVQNPLKGWS